MDANGNLFFIILSIFLSGHENFPILPALKKNNSENLLFLKFGDFQLGSILNLKIKSWTLLQTELAAMQNELKKIFFSSSSKTVHLNFDWIFA